MVPTLTNLAQEAAQEVTFRGGWNATAAKTFMLAFAFAAAALGLGMVGSSYMKALGRNPEAGKAAGQVVIIAAMIEVTALLAFLGALIVN